MDGDQNKGYEVQNYIERLLFQEVIKVKDGKYVLTTYGAERVKIALGIFAAMFPNTAKFREMFGVTRNAVWKYARYSDGHVYEKNMSLRGAEVVDRLLQWANEQNPDYGKPQTAVGTDPLEVAMGLPVEALINALRKRAPGITIHP